MRISLSIASRLKFLVSRNRSNCVGHENTAVRHELFTIFRKEEKREEKRTKGCIQNEQVAG